ncbi:hypothetical protein [Streptomyces sp. NBC_00154]|uniref:hypothetical protein n=1 Tax=Streptomyces sp. NBC_00154 TaxID=2975670 RepID=UPI0022528ECE|nr:hypothetical protein [Streptomyces sp. NBC_00154]MCX5316703.1 hypothetical protein [Streptomyces sp. NBC_00154]
MAPLSIDPRPLNADERAVLEHILSAEFVGASQLRSQLDRTEVIAIWGPDSVSVDLQVREPHEHAALPEALVPVDAQVHDPSGALCVGHVRWIPAHPVRVIGRVAVTCARQSHDTEDELNSVGSGAYNKNNRASWSRSDGIAPPSYREALPSCALSRKITRARRLFDLHEPRSVEIRLLTTLGSISGRAAA